jgi:hypothetical protein
LPPLRFRRRPAAVLATSLLFGALGSGPASAAADPVPLTDQLPPGWEWADVETPTVGVSGPAGTPLGTGSLRVPGGQTISTGFDSSWTPPAVDAFSGSVRPPATGSAAALVQVFLNSAPPEDDPHHLLWVPTEGTGSWRTFDLMTSDDIIVEYGQYGGGGYIDVDGNGFPDTFTWDSYLAATAANDVSLVKIGIAFRKGSDSRELFYLDNMTFGLVGNTTTYDFEPAPAWPLRTTVSRTELPYGSTVNVAGVLRDDTGALVEGTVLALYRKVWGDESFSVTNELAVTDMEGRVSAVQTPRRRTQYQWRVTEIRNQDLVQNFVPRTPVTVDVRRLITASVADTTLTPSQAVVVTGTTTPNAEGASVALRREGSTAPLLFGEVRSDGTYRLARKLPAGTWKIYTTVAANAGMLKGTSTKTTVTVK